MRILYVEDNPANISLLQRIARMGGHDVYSYNDGEVALAHFEQDKPDLILMDLQLAGALGGLDVVRKLRADGVTTPIIAVTAYAMVGDKERCMEAGCDGYLAKPLPVAELVETVQKYEQALKAKDFTAADALAHPHEDVSDSTEADRSRVIRDTAPLPDLAKKAAARKAAREKKEAAAKAASAPEAKPAAAPDTAAEAPTQPSQRIPGIHTPPESSQEAAVAATTENTESAKKD